ncbi:MAG: hypothetical protein R2684_14950 [Pyrinomonadaceae bacterium]
MKKISNLSKVKKANKSNISKSLFPPGVGRAVFGEPRKQRGKASCLKKNQCYQSENFLSLTFLARKHGVFGHKIGKRRIGNSDAAQTKIVR